MASFTDEQHNAAYWAQPANAVAERLQVNASEGLDMQEASRRLEEHGPNSILAHKRKSAWLILAGQFASPLIWLLAASTGLSFFFGEWLDGIAILVVIVINAGIGFWMELQAMRSMDALRKMSTVPARVRRGGQLRQIASEEVVPGDVLFVEEGDMITADARLLKESQLQADESALTGESLPVNKLAKELPGDTHLAERTNMLYKGTFVTKGNGYAVVTATGMATELGRVARLVGEAGKVASPLEKKIRQFSNKLIWVTVGLIVLIFVMGLLRGKELVSLLGTSIALAVAAIPEGLPVVSTMALAYGMLRMARQQVIVKKLSAVETLGGTSVICTDKTGTLTQNRIEASFVQAGRRASGIKVDAAGERLEWKEDEEIAGTPAFRHICRIAALCNTATYRREGEEETTAGDPLEIGLLKMVHCTPEKPEALHKAFPRKETIPFSSETRLMGTLHENEGRFYIAVKGAAEDVLAKCSHVLEDEQAVALSPGKKEEWLALAEQHAQSGLRLLAFAYRETGEMEKKFLHDLTLAGLIGFVDPPRPEVPAAIRECRDAGIRVIMITGDHPATARSIAEELGIAGPEDKVLHGRDMRPYKELDDAEKERWLDAAVFARVSPEQKLDLVSLLQEKNKVVGMTGDGVNDAPALRKADIGIAMGQRGTQVAQEVADMILKNDAFSSIVLAIRQGRVIFDNIRKFVVFLLSCNLSELAAIAVVAFLNLPFQLFPLQILFINLITDVLPALALGVTSGSPHIMKRKPYASNTAIVDRKRWTAIIVYSLVIGLAATGAVFTDRALLHPGEDWNNPVFNNILFYTIICCQLLHVFNMSFSPGVPFHKTEVFRNRYVWYAVVACVGLVLLAGWIGPVRKALHLSLDRWESWGIALLFALLSMLVIRLCKKLRWII